MLAPKTIAHEIGGVRADALRFGLQGVKSDVVRSHPIECAYQLELNHIRAVAVLMTSIMVVSILALIAIVSRILMATSVLKEWERRVKVGVSSTVTASIRASVRDMAIDKIKTHEKADHATVDLVKYMKSKD